MDQPITRWTRIVLTVGTVTAAACLVVGILLRLAGDALGTGDPLRFEALMAAVLELRAWAWSTLGVLVLLATPAAGLVATFLELRRPEPRVAWLSVSVLAVLAVAVLVALR